ncbi:MAG TPA: sigma-70 family RNA polymerase sigma factor [Acidimicrobiia bacterium]|nr:sigma-70 family RNA polymerase sigma factor [Acidimicrobiia bacterium]
MSPSLSCQEVAPTGVPRQGRHLHAVPDAGSPGVPTWEEVARDHGGFLYDVAYRLTGNHHDTQDLVQDALLKIRGGLERYQPGSLPAWIARIVTNQFLDEQRRRRRRPQAPLPDVPDHVLPSSPAADEHSSGLAEEVGRALQELPAEFRVPIVLCDVSDMSYAEIASATKVPVGTVRSRIHRGRRMLRAALESTDQAPVVATASSSA